MKAALLGTALAVLGIVMMPPVLAQQSGAFQLYMQVANGQRAWSSLTPQEQQQVAMVMAAMHPRYTSRKCDALADAEDALQSARDDLRSCLLNADADDDCDSQKQDEADAKDAYDQAKDDAEDDCQ